MRLIPVLYLPECFVLIPRSVSVCSGDPVSGLYFRLSVMADLGVLSAVYWEPIGLSFLRISVDVDGSWDSRKLVLIKPEDQIGSIYIL